MNITQLIDLFEGFRKCRAWLDDEDYIPKKFLGKSWSDRYTEKIITFLEDEIIKQKFSLHGDIKIYLPTKYFVFLNGEDSEQFSGQKKQILLQKLNFFVEKCFKTLSVNYTSNDFVKLFISTNLQKGEIDVTHQWDDCYAPQILIHSRSRSYYYNNELNTDGSTLD